MTTPNINIANIDLLSLSDKVIPDVMMQSYFLMINNFILELHNLKKKYQDVSTDQKTKSECLNKIKLAIDLVNIYKNPEILSIIKQYADDKEKERQHKEEMEKLRLELFQKRQREEANRPDPYGSVFGDFPMYGSLFGPRANDLDSDDDDVLSDVSEDEFENDKVHEMFDAGYESITRSSMLNRQYSIVRQPHCEVRDADESEDKEGDVTSDLPTNNESNEIQTVTKD